MRVTRLVFAAGCKRSSSRFWPDEPDILNLLALAAGQGDDGKRRWRRCSSSGSVRFGEAQHDLVTQAVSVFMSNQGRAILGKLSAKDPGNIK